jgi:hypothetical protein
MAKYKNTKKLTKKSRAEISDSSLHKILIAIPIIALTIKLITMFNIPNGGWLGADGENYLLGVDGLLAEGFFAKESVLSYWPAGYPTLLWPLASLTITKFFFLASTIQSIFFAYATYFLSNKLRQSSLKNFSVLVSAGISLNPTLSLSSLAIGYEAPVAACFMMITGIIWANANPTFDRKFWFNVVYVGGWFALATFMQPRFLLIAIIVSILWALKVTGTKNRIRIAALVTAIMLFAPAAMVFRNIVAIDKAVISTNLGVTMNIGAGPETSGGYLRSGPEVPCEPESEKVSVTDNERVICVVKWYLTNPIDTVRLSLNKSKLFWATWSGPLSTEGTMARNPWLKISPAQQLSAKSEPVRDFTFGIVGKLISWGWILGQMVFLFIGYRVLLKSGRDEKFFAQIVIAPVVLSWLISIGTIGDHRFRIPTMSLSLVLQLVGFMTIWKRQHTFRK